MGSGFSACSGPNSVGVTDSSRGHRVKTTTQVHSDSCDSGISVCDGTRQSKKGRIHVRANLNIHDVESEEEMVAGNDVGCGTDFLMTSTPRDLDCKRTESDGEESQSTLTTDTRKNRPHSKTGAKTNLKHNPHSAPNLLDHAIHEEDEEENDGEPEDKRLRAQRPPRPKSAHFRRSRAQTRAKSARSRGHLRNGSGSGGESSADMSSEEDEFDSDVLSIPDETASHRSRPNTLTTVRLGPQFHTHGASNNHHSDRHEDDMDWWTDEADSARQRAVSRSVSEYSASGSFTFKGGVLVRDGRVAKKASERSISSILLTTAVELDSSLSSTNHACFAVTNPDITQHILKVSATAATRRRNSKTALSKLRRTSTSESPIPEVDVEEINPKQEPVHIEASVTVVSHPSTISEEQNTSLSNNGESDQPSPRAPSTQLSQFSPKAPSTQQSGGSFGTELAKPEDDPPLPNQPQNLKLPDTPSPKRPNSKSEEKAPRKISTDISEKLSVASIASKECDSPLSIILDTMIDEAVSKLAHWGFSEKAVAKLIRSVSETELIPPGFSDVDEIAKLEELESAARKLALNDTENTRSKLAVTDAENAAQKLVLPAPENSARKVALSDTDNETRKLASPDAFEHLVRRRKDSETSKSPSPTHKEPVALDTSVAPLETSLRSKLTSSGTTDVPNTEESSPASNCTSPKLEDPTSLESAVEEMIEAKANEDSDLNQVPESPPPVLNSPSPKPVDPRIFEAKSPDSEELLEIPVQKLTGVLKHPETKLKSSGSFKRVSFSPEVPIFSKSDGYHPRNRLFRKVGVQPQKRAQAWGKKQKSVDEEITPRPYACKVCKTDCIGRVLLTC